MKLKIKLNEDHIKIIQQFKIREIDDNIYGFNTKDLLGGTFVLTDISHIIGKYSEYLPNTLYSADGVHFEEELETYMWGLYDYILDNFENIESILHSFISEGVKPGIYTALDYEMVWTYTPLEIIK